MFVKDAAGNEEPCVDFDTHAGAHAPLCFLGIVGDEYVDECGEVVDGNDGGTGDAFGGKDNP